MGDRGGEGDKSVNDDEDDGVDATGEVRTSLTRLLVVFGVSTLSSPLRFVAVARVVNV